MRIVIAAPIATVDIRTLLSEQDKTALKGYEGAPLLGTLIRTFVERGHEVVGITLDRSIWSCNPVPVKIGSPPFELFYVPVRAHSVRPTAGFRGRILDLYAQERRMIVDILSGIRCDVVHAHWTYEFALAALASGHPTVVTAHDAPLAVLRFMPNFYRLLRYVMARKVYNRAGVITAVSPHLVDQVGRYTRSTIDVIANPMPLSVAARQDRSVRQTPSAAPKVAMILNGWSMLKNAKPALEAFVSFRGRFPEAVMHVFGESYGPGQKAEAWARSRGFDRGVRFRGKVGHQEILDALSGSDLLVHPALEESCCMAIVEAMAIGLPVLGGRRSGGVPWQLHNGEAGILTDVTDSGAIADDMIRLFEEPERYENISRRALDRAKALFEPHAVASQYEHAYDKAIRQRIAPRVVAPAML